MYTCIRYQKKNAKNHAAELYLKGRWESTQSLKPSPWPGFPSMVLQQATHGSHWANQFSARAFLSFERRTSYQQGQANFHKNPSCRSWEAFQATGHWSTWLWLDPTYLHFPHHHTRCFFPPLVTPATQLHFPWEGCSQGHMQLDKPFLRWLSLLFPFMKGRSCFRAI